MLNTSSSHLPNTRSLTHSKRPKLVLLIAITEVITGTLIILYFGGLVLPIGVILAFLSLPFADILVIYSGLYIFVGVAIIVIGIGSWRLRSWAWLISVILSFFIFVLLVYLSLWSLFVQNAVYFGLYLIPLVFVVLVYFILIREHFQGWPFQVSTPTTDLNTWLMSEKSLTRQEINITQIIHEVITQQPRWRLVNPEEELCIEKFNLCYRRDESLLSGRPWCFFKLIPPNLTSEIAFKLSADRTSIIKSKSSLFKWIADFIVFIYISESNIPPDVLNHLGNFDSMRKNPRGNIHTLNVFLNITSGNYIRPQKIGLFGYLPFKKLTEEIDSQIKRIVAIFSENSQFKLS